MRAPCSFAAYRNVSQLLVATVLGTKDRATGARYIVLPVEGC